MAETFLTPVIEKLIELLAEEVSSLKGVHKEAKSLKDELEIIQPFLKDAEAKSERGEVSYAAKVWLKQIREEADRIEDVVDEYLHHLSQRRQQQGGFADSLRKAGHFIKALKPRRDIASEIRDIKDSLREIKERGQSYGLRPFEQGSSRGTTTADLATPINSRLGSLFIEDEELVGIDSTSEKLIRSLVEEPSARMVISVVGEGGIGKTTLAKRVYGDEVVKGHFDCHVWITVSQSYDVEKILRMMKKRICPTRGQPGEEIDTIEELMSLLRQHLQTKRYVVVFDDVWQSDFWDVMKHALPNNNKGSRIIVTTRNSTVVDSFNETPLDFVHELKTWSSDLAWELFCKNAFRFKYEGKCPQELEELSRKIVSKCQGLPLVIIAVAGLLSKKEKVKMEWQSVLDNIDYEFEKNPQLTNVSKVLSFSYHDLPYHLKPCFLYFGIFPEDCSISEERLSRLWIAEGFIESRRDKTLEQVAKEYLSELNRRNLVSFDVEYGIHKWCRVHDLIRDIILKKVDEFSFCQFLEEKKLRFRGKSRRLSVYGNTKDVQETVDGDFKLRSVFLFNINEMTKSFVVGLFENFKLLKLLDFEDAPLDNLPHDIGNLFHLRYLNLRGTSVKMLPKSIGKLQNLQVLDVCQTFVKELPIEINKLRNLQYLLAYRFDDKEGEYSFNSFCGVRMKGGIGCLEELQTLHLVEPYVNGIDFVKELEKLRKLKTLGIGMLTREMEMTLGASIEKMKGLEKLYVNSINEDEVLDLKCILSPPPFLWHLSLRCRLQQFPDWISKLENLRELSLRFSRLMDEPLKRLKALPNLAFLYLYKAYDGEELHFEEGGFPKLKQLRLRNLDGLKDMKIDGGALPLLEKFVFGPSPLMKEIPSGLQHLTNLKSLDFKSMPREFVVSLQPNIGPDYWKIQHLPSVTFTFKREFFKLGSSELLQRLRE
ncbi:hypothetical protein TIFTF001_029969 [Ficus carica]|uniref:NB-ARC domain, LRR domain containing protein n=1 Tax=Ficus carica TaxID=3494 RepID=A0AA88DSV1_FICCA|nr:hypothetical protein TIFTF001_029969 [Ficus carica]